MQSNRKSIFRRPLTWLFLAGWLATVGIGLGGLLEARRQTLAGLNNPAGQAQWQQWKQATHDIATGDGPVARRPVKVDEPPGVILMRDHFAAVTVVSLAVASLLYGFLFVAIRGAMQTSPRDRAETTLSMPETDGLPPKPPADGDASRQGGTGPAC